MAIQVFEIELTGKIDPIIVDKNYTNCRILIRYEKIPIGWIQFSYRNKRMITSEDVLAATKKQLDWSIIKNFLTIGKEAVQDEPRIHPISIVVCTRNRTHFLSECIRSLLKLNYPAYEIIIIDNAPGNDDTKNLVEGFPVRYVKEAGPV
jgi:cellulose synthase/poly-beta-1,6-N-acetylglucosamine synthase-like glycosyltransferase